MWLAVFSQLLTCTTLPHDVLLFRLTLLSAHLCLSFRKTNVESCTLKSRKLVQRRRNTCPSPQDISRALQSPSSAPSTSAASLDELIQRCLNCFGQSLSLWEHVFPKFVPLLQPDYVMEGWWSEENLERGEQGGRKRRSRLIQSSFVLLVSRGLDYFHTLLLYSPLSSIANLVYTIKRDVTVATHNYVQKVLL